MAAKSLKELQAENPEAFAKFPSVEEFPLPEPIEGRASLEELLAEATPILGRGGKEFLHVAPTLADMGILVRAVNAAQELGENEDVTLTYERLAETARRVLWVRESEERMRPAAAAEISAAFTLPKLRQILMATLLGMGLEVVAGGKK